MDFKKLHWIVENKSKINYSYIIYFIFSISFSYQLIFNLSTIKYISTCQMLRTRKVGNNMTEFDLKSFVVLFVDKTFFIITDPSKE
jgi:hypothetical protein